MRILLVSFSQAYIKTLLRPAVTKVYHTGTEMNPSTINDLQAHIFREALPVSFIWWSSTFNFLAVSHTFFLYLTSLQYVIHSYFFLASNTLWYLCLSKMSCFSHHALLFILFVFVLIPFLFLHYSPTQLCSLFFLLPSFFKYISTTAVLPFVKTVTLMITHFESHIHFLSFYFAISCKTGSILFWRTYAVVFLWLNTMIDAVWKM